MENTIIERFNFFPGVIIEEGEKNIAIINLAKGEIFQINKNDLYNKDNQDKVIKDLEEKGLGKIVLSPSTNDFKLNTKLFEYENDKIKVFILDSIEYIELIEAPISFIDLYLKDNSKNEETVRALVRQKGYLGHLNIRKYNSSKCPYIYSNKKPLIIPYSNSFNKKFNYCWGKTIAIDNVGNVKCCLWHDEIICKIGEVPFDSIIEKLNPYWTLTKNKIEVCKDCELKFVCSDCRVSAIKHNGHLYSKTAFCEYNPKS
jgi:radical SAM protein with 4Fe4S-binding SPASM domain